MSTHQERIARCITAILQLDEQTVQAFCKGNPFDKLLRSFDEFAADGTPLYRREAARRHYQQSQTAYTSSLPIKELYGEHRKPLSCVIRELLASDRQEATVLRLLRQNEVVLITKEEACRLDRSRANGGMGLKSSLPTDGSCRLQAAGIQLAPETRHHRL